MPRNLYTALDNSKSEIRLLNLQPRCSTQPDYLLAESSVQAGPDQLHGSLRVASLDDKPQYTALSYVWGDANDTLPIFLDGLEFKARKNLIDALTHIQDDNEAVTLWVDAVCINQEDAVEKTAQISQMLRIYQSAQTTTVWLGMSAEGSDEIIQFCRDLGSTLSEQAMAAATLEQRQNLPAVIGQLLEANPQFMRLLQDPAMSRLKDPFEKLLNDPYWSRLWCLQEISVSKNIVVACGKMRVCLHEFETAIQALSLMLHAANFHLFSTTSMLEMGNITDPVPMVTAAHRMLDQRRGYHRSMHGGGEGPVSLLHLLFRSYVMDGFRDVTLRATLESDRIYGLLGLAGDAKKLAIVPDYKKPWTDVYIETSSALLRNGNAAFLVLCQNGAEGGGELPSWVADWRQALRESPSTWPGIDRPFMACGPRTAIECLPTQDAKVFAIKGVVISRTDKMGQPLEVQPEHYFANGFSSVLTFLDEIQTYLRESLALGPNVSPYSESNLDEAKWRIPVGDMEMITAASSTCVRRRATAVSREGYQSVMHIASTYNGLMGQGAGNSANQAALTTLAMTMMQNMSKFSLVLVMMHYMQDRRPFRSSNGYVGLGPNKMQAGDLVVIFFGSHTPFIIRPCNNGMHRLVGEAYIHGIMDGEFMKQETKEIIFQLY
jgi:hypothetical protein